MSVNTSGLGTYCRCRGLLPDNVGRLATGGGGWKSAL